MEEGCLFEQRITDYRKMQHFDTFLIAWMLYCGFSPHYYTTTIICLHAFHQILSIYSYPSCPFILIHPIHLFLSTYSYPFILIHLFLSTYSYRSYPSILIHLFLSTYSYPSYPSALCPLYPYISRMHTSRVKPLYIHLIIYALLSMLSCVFLILLRLLVRHLAEPRTNRPKKWRKKSHLPTEHCSQKHFGDFSLAPFGICRLEDINFFNIF